MTQDNKASNTGQLAGYLQAYGQLRAERHEREPLWMQQLREDAWERFSARGFPTTHDEDWRFTKVYVRRQGKWRVVSWQASESAPD